MTFYRRYAGHSGQLPVDNEFYNSCCVLYDTEQFEQCICAINTPNNILVESSGASFKTLSDVASLLCWAIYKTGEYEDCWRHLTECRNLSLLDDSDLMNDALCAWVMMKRGQIYAARDLAKSLMKRAKDNSCFDNYAHLLFLRGCVNIGLVPRIELSRIIK